MVHRFATIDFHVTSECNQECPYCWGPQEFDHPVDTQTALLIVARVKEVGARRIVFTGGDPLKRSDVAQLIRRAKDIGLEVALSTTGDELSPELLEEVAPYLDLISLPVDGSSEEVSSRTKKEGHFTAIRRALGWLRKHPGVDLKLCTPVTRHNLDDVPNLIRLAEGYSRTTKARVFCNFFQTFPRSTNNPDWDEILVSDEEFAQLAQQGAGKTQIRVNYLSHATLDRLYVMIFPDGSLVVPTGPKVRSFGPFLDIDDLDEVLATSAFDSARHLDHSRRWGRTRL